MDAPDPLEYSIPGGSAEGISLGQNRQSRCAIGSHYQATLDLPLPLQIGVVDLRGHDLDFQARQIDAITPPESRSRPSVKVPENLLVRNLPLPPELILRFELLEHRTEVD